MQVEPVAGVSGQPSAQDINQQWLWAKPSMKCRRQLFIAMPTMTCICLAQGGAGTSLRLGDAGTNLRDVARESPTGDKGKGLPNDVGVPSIFSNQLGPTRREKLGQ